MSSTTSTSSATIRVGPGVFGLLGVAFVVLKLTGYIDWSWWWVTAPFWGGLALSVGVMLGAVVLAAVVAGIAGLFIWLTDRR